MRQHDEETFIKRFWVYQSERFPFFKNGLLIFSFAVSAVCLSALLRGETTFPSVLTMGIAFFALFGHFLILRIADEFKDRELDARARPELPVPRGLVKLKELAVVGILVAALQLAFSLYHSLLFALLLLSVWGYMFLMTVEFGVAGWLRKRPLFYLLSHMLIMPIIDFYATSADWSIALGHPPEGLLWFLVISVFNGIIIEIGRKTWIPEKERPEVESYSSVWGIPLSLIAWSAAVISSYACAIAVATRIGFLWPAAIGLGAVALLLLYTAFAFHAHRTLQHQKLFENLSGLWVFCTYITLGIIPMGVAAWF